MEGGVDDIVRCSCHGDVTCHSSVLAERVALVGHLLEKPFKVR